MPRFLFPLIFFASLCPADPRAKPSDYPAHAESAHVALGAEYLVHSFSNGRQSYFLPDYLVVDTAIYPHGKLTVSPAHFQLRINGSVNLHPQAPNMVGYSIGAGNFQSDSIGRQQPRFPGDPSGAHPPQTTQAPDPSQSAEDAGPESVKDALVRTALQEGEFHGPQSGFLYFSFEGKTKKIKSLDLVYTDDAGELVVKLF